MKPKVRKTEKPAQVKKKDPGVPEIQLDLLENGLDFISNSLDPLLKAESEHELKYSILHLHAGVELIIKEILRKEHWSLIFEKIETADKAKLQTGDFVSVNNATSLTRLRNICQIQFEPNELANLEALRKKRNIIEHFVFHNNPNELRSIASEVLIVVLKLIDENLDAASISFQAKINLDNIRRKSSDFTEFADRIMLKIKTRLVDLSKEYEIIKCPECFQKSFVLNEELICLFCNYTDNPPAVAKAYIENIMRISEYYEVTQGGYFPLEYCPECGAHALVPLDDGYKCFSCLNKWKHGELENCGRCNSLYLPGKSDMGMCESCMDNWYAYVERA